MIVFNSPLKSDCGQQIINQSYLFSYYKDFIDLHCNPVWVYVGDCVQLSPVPFECDVFVV